ncbi:fucose permease [Oribacterium sinus]|uniref:Fucose permease n=1 Tax=Oribacterium sinus TaxID=237576 RepID=A0A7W9SGV5_9FIRM|nr:MFS transporter [Oribacterium sinus]MBB6041125.1 fucose permease [Oribacterium sinus]
MFSILLLMIYLAFISLGLPDALLGSAWPIMYQEFAVPVSYSGTVFMIICGGTILSSLNSEKLNRRFGTGKITAISVFLTAIALFGFSISHSFLMLCLFAIPYGLGAGSVDAALNHYVALHYSSRHMSWLHCMWGLGASVGPYIMGFVLQRGEPWNRGYLIVSIIQFILAIILFCSLSLWKKNPEELKENGSNAPVGMEGKATSDGAEAPKQRALSLKEVFAIPGAKESLASFYGYCALEQTVGLWAGSFMVLALGMEEKLAASYVALFYFGITFGRFLSGFFTMKWKDEQMVLGGSAIVFFGIFLLFTPWSKAMVLPALILIGLGCAPVYPSVIHSTPYNFGVEHSSALIGAQMASAYVGTLIMPPLFGVLGRSFSMKLFPYYSMILLLFMVFTYRRMLQVTKKARREKR